MELFLFSSLLFAILDFVQGGSCYLAYYRCDGYDWCCPDGYVCTGSSTCLSIGAIVGACIGGIIGLSFFVAMIYFCCRPKGGRAGRVMAQPAGGAAVVSTGQYGQTQYGQPGGQPYGQPGGQPYEQPGGQPYGQPGGQPYGQPGGSYPQTNPSYPPQNKS